MKIGLYFGSFNPIHHGHLIIANYVLQFGGLDQVWIIVSPQNPFKPSAQLLNEYHRLHLVQLALEGETRLKASDLEFHLPKPSYTIDSLAYLEEKYPHHIYSIIQGSDSYQNIPKWKNAGVILDRYDMIVYNRPGFPVKAHGKRKPIVIDAPLLQISATHIREYIKNRMSVRYLVPDKVWEEIERNGYYR